MPPAAPESPPKRLTRARAKAAEDGKSTIKTVKVATPASKATAARLTKRKSRSDDNVEDNIAQIDRPSECAKVDAETAPARVALSRPVKAPARRTATVPITRETFIDTAVTEEQAAPKRQRGRPKKNEPVGETNENNAVTEVSAAKATKGPTGGSVARRGRLAATGISVPPMRKKVTFNLESDKENTVKPSHGEPKAAKAISSTSDAGLTPMKAQALRRPSASDRRKKSTVEKQPDSPSKQDIQSLSIMKLNQTSTVQLLENDVDELDEVEVPIAVALSSPKRIDNNKAKSTQPTIAEKPEDKPLPILQPVSPNQMISPSNKAFTFKTTFGPTIAATPAKRLPALSSGTTTKTMSSLAEPTPANGGVKPKLSTAHTLAQPPRRLQLGLPPVLEATTNSHFASSLSGSAVRRPPRRVREFAPDSAFKHPAPKMDSKASLYGTPARKPPSPTKRDATIAGARKAAVTTSHNSTSTVSSGQNFTSQHANMLSVRGLDTTYNILNSSIYGSPVRRPPSPVKEPGSPHSHNNHKTSIYGSPPRRPASPTKPPGSAGAESVMVKTGGPHSSMYGTPARRPPSPMKAFTLTSSRMSPTRLGSTLLSAPVRRPASPEKFNAPPSTSKVAADVYVSSSGSPIRRPVTPHIGTATPRKSPHKTSPKKEKAHQSPSRATPPRPIIQSAVIASSALRLNRSPEASAKVYTMTVEEQAEMFQHEILKDAIVCTPNRSKKRVANSDVPSHQKERSLANITPKSVPKRNSVLAMEFPDAKENVTPPTAQSIQVRSTTPDEPLPTVGTAFDLVRDIEQLAVNVEDSTDELQLDDTYLVETPGNLHGLRHLGDPPRTPGSLTNTAMAKGTMTALADRFCDWKGTTPNTTDKRTGKTVRSIFSPFEKCALSANTAPDSRSHSPDKNSSFLMMPDMTGELLFSPARPSQFEEAMAIREDFDELTLEDPMGLNGELFRQSQISDASQEYGDENVAPIQPILYQPVSTPRPNGTCTPARMFEKQPMVIHTVSKVPLKPAAEFNDTPVSRPLRRSHSLSGPLSPQSMLDLQALRQIHPQQAVIRVPLAERLLTPKASPAACLSNHVPALELTSTPPQISVPCSTFGTPARTPRADLNSKLLRGCVAFVDVHTTEGADASGIFTELLTQMGARCVKQWAWNERASSTNGDDMLETKVGITHVVFKDGGKRTMQKVRAANGLVSFVGVAWVLDCERENKWLDESTYAIDTSMIPRGGHRRRKSMEPRSCLSSTSHNYMSPSKEFLNLNSSPVADEAMATRVVSGSMVPVPEQIELGIGSVAGFIIATDEHAQFTPTPSHDKPAKSNATTPLPANGTPAPTPTPSLPVPLLLPLEVAATTPTPSSVSSSPSTPYFLHPSQLIQQTCPPKQTQEPLTLDVGKQEGGGEEGQGDHVRRRLALVRRQSLQFAPRVGSPLRGGW